MLKLLKERTGNKYLKTLSLLILTIGVCNAQNNKLSDFIPKGYVEFNRYFGDLNGDGQDDSVLIVKGTDKKNIVINRFEQIVDRNRRGIIVLFKDGDGYRLADKNYNCFSSENEDGGVYYAPELSIDFARGNLIVHYAHGRYGFWKYVFRFQDANFKLIGYDASDNRGPRINTETSINFLTKKKLVRENTNIDDEGGEEIFKETWSNIKLKNLIKLSEINDFDELSMYEL